MIYIIYDIYYIYNICDIYYIYNICDIYIIYIYYLAIKKKEILPFATTWMDLGSVMIRETHRTEKDKTHKMSLTWGILQKGKPKNQNKNKKNPELIDTENRLVVARDRGWGTGKVSESHQTVQTSSYKINKAWGSDVQPGDYS